MRFECTEGEHIYVGRNTRPNEELAFKSATKDDLRHHAQKGHASHESLSFGDNPQDD